MMAKPTFIDHIESTVIFTHLYLDLLLRNTAFVCYGQCNQMRSGFCCGKYIILVRRNLISVYTPQIDSGS